MSIQTTTYNTSIAPDEVIVRAVHFLSTGKWKVTSQSLRSATFEGKPAIPWFMILLTIIGFMMCLVPGVIMYIMFIRKMNRFINLIVTVTSIDKGTQVVIQHPSQASKLVTNFTESLPPLSK